MSPVSPCASPVGQGPPCPPAVGGGVSMPCFSGSGCPPAMSGDVPRIPQLWIRVSLFPHPVCPSSFGEHIHTCALPSPTCLCPPRCAAPQPPAPGVGQSSPAAPWPPTRPNTGLQQQQDPGGAGRELRYGERHLSGVTPAHRAARSRAVPSLGTAAAPRLSTP